MQNLFLMFSSHSKNHSSTNTHLSLEVEHCISALQIFTQILWNFLSLRIKAVSLLFTTVWKQMPKLKSGIWLWSVRDSTIISLKGNVRMVTTQCIHVGDIVEQKWIPQEPHTWATNTLLQHLYSSNVKAAKGYSNLFDCVKSLRTNWYHSNLYDVVGIKLNHLLLLILRLFILDKHFTSLFKITMQ